MLLTLLNRCKTLFRNTTEKGVDIARLLAPYFSFDKKNIQNLLLLAAIVALCIVRAMLIIWLSDVGTTWFGLFNSSNLILGNIITPTLLLFGIYLPLDSLCDSLSSFCANSLSNRIAKQMNADYIERYFRKKTFHGVKIQDPDKRRSSKLHIEVLSKNIKKFTGSLIEPATTILTAFVSASVSIYQLFYMSPGLQIVAGFTVPYYLPLLAVVYGAISFAILKKFTSPIHKLSRKENKLQLEQQSQLHYCDTNSESIAMLNGGKYESQYLQNISNEKYDIRGKKIKHKSVRKFIEKFGELVSYPLGALVCVPGLINGMTTFALDRNSFFAISTHFGKVLAFVNDFSLHHDKMISFSHAYNNIKDFEADAQNWRNKQKQLKENIKETNNLEFKGSIYLNNSNVLHNQNIKIKPGRTYLLSAPSGTGKSTLLKTFSGINPHFKGKIKLPKNTVFVPQAPYFFRHASSLLDNLAFPLTPSQHPQNLLAKIPDWLNKLKIKKEIIMQLKVVKKNWDQVLSPGEKQRLAIVRAILQQPECLIMDEPTSAVGSYAGLVKDLIRKELPNATILYTDHNPSDGYPDERVIELSPTTSRLTLKK